MISWSFEDAKGGLVFERNIANLGQVDFGLWTTKYMKLANDNVEVVLESKEERATKGVHSMGERNKDSRGLVQRMTNFGNCTL